MRAAARRRGRCAAPRCRYNRLSLAKVGCGAMEGAKSLDQGPGSEEVWAPADVWAQAGLAREALEALPVAGALAVRRAGPVEPELRPEERRVGAECGSTRMSPWTPWPTKKKRPKKI